MSPTPPRGEAFPETTGNVVVYLGCQARSSLWEEERALLLWKREKIWLQTWVRGEEQRNKIQAI